MVIMVFKNINQTPKKKKFIYLLVWPAQSTPFYFFANLEPGQKPRNFTTEDQSYRIHQKINQA